MEIYPFCQRVHIGKQSSILISRSKHEAWFPWRSTLRSNSLGYILLNDFRNYLSLFIAQRSMLQKIHLK